MSDDRRKFLYRGKGLEELKKMNMKAFIQLLPSRQRRSLLRGMPRRQKKFLKKLKKAVKALKADREIVIRTHNRDMIIFPEFIGLTVGVYNGIVFVPVKITPDHIGHFMGEFSPTCKKVSHGNPGVGATRSSQFVPLK
jgi:small subunit ribosomal protein S19